jgi:regulator of RNase E activity RraA
VTIDTGDYLLGDRDGIVIIPRAIVEGGDENRRSRRDGERNARRADRGMDPVDAYNRYGKF